MEPGQKGASRKALNAAEKVDDTDDDFNMMVDNLIDPETDASFSRSGWTDMGLRAQEGNCQIEIDVAKA